MSGRRISCPRVAVTTARRSVADRRRSEAVRPCPTAIIMRKVTIGIAVSTNGSIADHSALLQG